MMKEKIKIEVTAEIEYNTKKGRKCAIDAAIRLLPPKGSDAIGTGCGGHTAKILKVKEVDDIDINKIIVEGAILVAIDECKMDDGGEKTLTIGKEYKVEKAYSNEFLIIDDEGERHYFEFKNYTDFFKIK